MCNSCDKLTNHLQVVLRIIIAADIMPLCEQLDLSSVESLVSAVYYTQTTREVF